MRGTLDSEQIAATALRIADVEGMAGLTMRRLAAECGVTTMATYWHVKNKDELVDLVVQYAFSAVPEPNPDGDWRAEMRQFFLAAHALLVAHPAVAQAMAQRPLGGTQVTSLADRALATLINAGFSDEVAVAAFLEFGSYTLGASLYEVGRSGWTEAQPESRFSGLSPDAHPTLIRLGDRLAGAIGDGLFEDGLARLIDSYDARR